MRLNPPLEIIPTRKLSEPMQLGPYTLEPGTGLMPCPILTQRNPELYPEPESFKPERFLGKRPNVFEYFPFGGGAETLRGLCICELPNEIGYRNGHSRIRFGTARSGAKSNQALFGCDRTIGQSSGNHYPKTAVIRLKIRLSHSMRCT